MAKHLRALNAAQRSAMAKYRSQRIGKAGLHGGRAQTAPHRQSISWQGGSRPRQRAAGLGKRHPNHSTGKACRSKALAWYGSVIRCMAVVMHGLAAPCSGRVQNGVAKAVTSVGRICKGSSSPGLARQSNGTARKVRHKQWQGPGCGSEHGRSKVPAAPCWQSSVEPGLGIAQRW